MRLDCAGAPHLTYCTNIHPGESWKEVRHHLEHGVSDVRRALGIRRMGVGLRLSARAAEELAQPGEVARLQERLDADGLYVFTLNGFPYGPFHGRPIKQAVYTPDWSTPERLAYTNRLADLLADLLPEGSQGSISTLPGAFRTSVRSEADVARIVDKLIAHVVHLHALHRERGVSIALALEPEPACFLETTEEAVAFFEGRLLGATTLAGIARATGAGLAESETLLRRHLGVCLDACHSAVEFEDPLGAVDRLERAGIGIPKVQLSAGLRIRNIGPETRSLLGPFDDGVYLHQVVESRGGELHRFLDLGDAFEDLCGRERAAPAEPAEWRIHFHVPIFREPPRPLESTQDLLARLLERQRERPISSHLEVETYTWDVLPVAHRGADMISDIASELRWVRDRLDA